MLTRKVMITRQMWLAEMRLLVVWRTQSFVSYDGEYWNRNKEGWPKWLVVLLTQHDED